MRPVSLDPGNPCGKMRTRDIHLIPTSYLWSPTSPRKPCPPRLFPLPSSIQQKRGVPDSSSTSEGGPAHPSRHEISGAAHAIERQMRPLVIKIGHITVTHTSRSSTYCVVHTRHRVLHVKRFDGAHLPCSMQRALIETERLGQIHQPTEPTKLGDHKDPSNRGRLKNLSLNFAPYSKGLFQHVGEEMIVVKAP